MTRISIVLVFMLAGCPSNFEGSSAGECSDGLDNDGNDLIDCRDPSCFGAVGCTTPDASMMDANTDSDAGIAVDSSLDSASDSPADILNDFVDQPGADTLVNNVPDGMFIGNAVHSTHYDNEPMYKRIHDSEFNQVTAEWEMKWGAMEETRGNVNYQFADRVMEIAEANNQMVRGHTLVWHSVAPDWLAGLSSEELQATVDARIADMMGRYRGRIAMWDVVNEAISELGSIQGNGLRPSVFLDKLGPGFIADAFRKARAADPDAILTYNDYDVSVENEKSNVMYGLVRDMKQDGVPIDAVGFQVHIRAYQVLLGDITEDKLRANVRRFADLGVDVYFTELDVQVGLLAADQTQRDDIQRRIYHMVANVCRTEPACKGLTLWGFADKFSWVPLFFQPDTATIYDENWNRKPSYEGLRAAFRGEPTPPFDGAVESSCPEPGTHVFCDPFEHVNLAGLFTAGATPAVFQTDEVFQGDGAIRTQTTGGGQQSFFGTVAPNDVRSGTLSARAFVRVEADGNLAGSELLTFTDRDPPNKGLTTMFGDEGLRLVATTGDGASTPDSTPFPRGSWECIAVEIEVGSSGSAKLFHGNTMIQEMNNVNTLPEGGFDLLVAGQIYKPDGTSGATIYFDDVAIDTAPLRCP